MTERDSRPTADPPPPPEVEASGEQPGRDELVPGVGAVVAGKYRIEGMLGRGGMGVVARGRQLELDRPVAIKFLKQELALDARPLQRFAREARLIAKMRSEHVVRVFDVGRENGVPYIVMEHLTGCDLAHAIAGGPLVVERAVELVLHACEALGEAHSLGIVHRDVKPSNLFLSQGFGGRETLKVLDFGISKWLLPAPDSDTPHVITTDAGAVGTPAFASPEQLTRPESIDGRTDVWALGVVLYQALSGKLPFVADTIPSLYSQIISKPPAPFPAVPNVPDELVAVITRCLSRSPEDRYPHMLDLARALLPFAPPRAKHIVESLATLPPPAPEEARASRGPSAPGAPTATTLELGTHTTPDATVASRALEPPRKRRGPWGPLLVIGAAAAAAVIALRPRVPDPSVLPKESTVSAPLVPAPPEPTLGAFPHDKAQPHEEARPAPLPSTAPAASSVAARAKRPPLGPPRGAASAQPPAASAAAVAPVPVPVPPAASAAVPNQQPIINYRH
ncbi:MAG TPA: protein kinase [Polyangiaceae bacterium]